jgi:hypothetical protein
VGIYRTTFLMVLCPLEFCKRDGGQAFSPLLSVPLSRSFPLAFSSCTGGGSCWLWSEGSGFCHQYCYIILSFVVGWGPCFGKVATNVFWVPWATTLENWVNRRYQCCRSTHSLTWCSTWGLCLRNLEIGSHIRCTTVYTVDLTLRLQSRMPVTKRKISEGTYHVCW